MVPTEDVPQLIKMRHELLATIPLPENHPELTLSPIVLPAQITLHDFINGSPVVSDLLMYFLHMMVTRMP